MKHPIKLFTLLSSILLASCGGHQEEVIEQTLLPKTPVEITSIQYGSVDDELLLFGTTIYLKRNMVTAPIPAFITNVRIKLGDKVNQGDVLYELESKERRALGNSMAKVDTALANFGIIKVKASASGIISTLDKQQPGDYVLEGMQLCTIAESSDLAFQVNVPYEFTPFAKQGTSCSIVLPDNSIHQATLTKPLTAMNVLAQTQTILAKTNENLFLPENMIVKVIVSKGTKDKKQILPKACVLTDEMMKEYWVMKLTNDSIAVKIPVTIGNKNTERIEIITPQFNPNDKIISNGNYGLADTALVKIEK
jgi:hypothetical protein